MKRHHLLGAIGALLLLFTVRLVLSEVILPSMQTNWEFCSDELKSAPLSDDLEVYCTNCPAINGSDTKCYLKKGEIVDVIIRFKPRVNIPNVERLIIARVPAPLGKTVEMPYGPPLSPCPNVTSTSGTGCVDEGVEAGKFYTYASTFNVLRSFPAVDDLQTRFIMRQKNEKHRKLRLYKKHPGPTVYCVMVSNIYVID